MLRLRPTGSSVGIAPVDYDPVVVNQHRSGTPPESETSVGAICRILGSRSAPLGTPTNCLFHVLLQALMRNRRGSQSGADSQSGVQIGTDWTPPCDDAQGLTKEIERNPAGSAFDAGSHQCCGRSSSLGQLAPTYSLGRPMRLIRRHLPKQRSF